MVEEIFMNEEFIGILIAKWEAQEELREEIENNSERL